MSGLNVVLSRWPRHAKHMQVFGVALMGVAGFLMVIGYRVLDPTNIAWLGSGDPSTHYLGWHFFRSSEWFVPIGLNPRYGLELSSAIIFSDSNPLFAFLFKPFAAFLPANFQYFGLWLLLCFVLQAVFGWKLVGLISNDPWIRIVGAGFFVFAPPMLWRLQGHLSLVGHFVILVALYISLRPSQRGRLWAWSLTLAAAAMVHAYLLAMCVLLWIADMVATMLRRDRSGRALGFELGVIFCLIIFICWQVGYFSVGADVGAHGYGHYRMNLLSMVDSSGWSYVLRDIPESKGEYEGFNFLGLGVIILFILGLPGVVAGKTRCFVLFRGRAPLLVVLVGMFVYALSSTLGVGASEYQIISLPDWLTRVAEVFRASGRMFWPFFYVVVLIGILLVAKGLPARAAATLLGVALLVQVADTHAAWKGLRSRMNIEASDDWKSPLTNKFWTAAAERYDKVRWLPPGNISPHWQTLASYAGRGGMATDAVYLARVDGRGLAAAQERARRELEEGAFEADSLYVMDAQLRARVAAHVDPQKDLFAQIDGFYVLAPGWRSCPQCIAAYDGLGLIEGRQPVGMGQPLNFSKMAHAIEYLDHGWSTPESWGTWSEARSAGIRLPIKSESPRAILIEAGALVSPTHPRQRVEVTLNSVHVGTFEMSSSSMNVIRVALPNSVRDMLEKGGLLIVEFQFPDAVRPVDIGINADQRLLAMGLLSMRLE